MSLRLRILSALFACCIAAHTISEEQPTNPSPEPSPATQLSPTEQELADRIITLVLFVETTLRDMFKISDEKMPKVGVTLDPQYYGNAYAHSGENSITVSISWISKEAPYTVNPVLTPILAHEYAHILGCDSDKNVSLKILATLSTMWMALEVEWLKQVNNSYDGQPLFNMLFFSKERITHRLCYALPTWLICSSTFLYKNRAMEKEADVVSIHIIAESFSPDKAAELMLLVADFHKSHMPTSRIGRALAWLSSLRSTHPFYSHREELFRKAAEDILKTQDVMA